MSWIYMHLTSFLKMFKFYMYSEDIDPLNAMVLHAFIRYLSSNSVSLSESVKQCPKGHVTCTLCLALLHESTFGHL